MTLSPTISRWSSLVFSIVFLHLSHAYLFPLSKQKKTSSRFHSVCSAFSASNSLQIFRCLVSWGDKWFHSNELGHTGLFSSAQPKSFGASEAHNSESPIPPQENQLATYSCFLFAPAPLNDSCPLPASHSTCSVTQGPTHLYHMSKRALLGNWCQRGRERSHQSVILRIGGERENTQGERVSQLGESNIIKDLWCLVFKRRDVTCL